MKEEKVRQEDAGLKSMLAKAAGAEPSGQTRGGEKLHAIVARSTFPSQNAQKASGLRHFSTCRCRLVWQIGR